MNIESKIIDKISLVLLCFYVLCWVFKIIILLIKEFYKGWMHITFNILFILIFLSILVCIIAIIKNT